MVCIYCGSPTHVTNSRHRKESCQVWRRRTCVSCGAVFTSTEVVDYPKSLVLEMPDKTLRPFKKEKLFLSIYTCCGHRKSSLDDATALTETIIAKTLRSSVMGVIPAGQLTIIAHTTLSNFDPASAVQFAAYHADYQL